MRLVKCLYNNGQLKKDVVYLLIGEIDNMVGHLVVADGKGHIFCGYHPENFEELDDD